MEFETRLTNLENLVSALIKDINRKEVYTSADIGGVRKAVSEITPYMDSKRAYIGDTTAIFTGVRTGNITAYCELDSGVVVQITSITRVSDTVTIGFDALEEVATVTISVL